MIRTSPNCPHELSHGKSYRARIVTAPFYNRPLPPIFATDYSLTCHLPERIPYLRASMAVWSRSGPERRNNLFLATRRGP
ncbi:MAG: hypothetical protein ACP5J6_11100 [Candidatus Saccharicenans sp.]